MNAVTPHVFEDHLVRSVLRDEEPWFVGADVCGALAIRNSRDALARLDDDEKGVANTDTLGGSQAMIIVSEPGVFRLIFTSRKPEAERFKRWLAHEVLPQLRRDGHYGQRPEPEPMSITNEAVPVITAKLQLVREARHLFGQDRARSLWRDVGLPTPELVPDGSRQEARECLEEILMQKPGEGEFYVRQILEEALNDNEGATQRLAQFGLKPVFEPEEGFLVANKHPWLTQIYRDGRWQHGGHMRVLRRLRGAAAAPKARYGAFEARGTFIPARYLDEPPQE